MVSKNQVKRDLVETNNKYESDLNLFLMNIHQAPSHYKEEIIVKVGEFNKAFETFKENSQKRDENFAKLCVFLANVVEYFRKDLDFLVPTVSEALSSYATTMHPFVRMKCVQCLAIIAKKGLWDPMESITFLIKLFIVKDKELRTFLTNHILAAIKKLMEKNKDNKMRTKLTKMFNDLLADSNDKISKRAFLILTQLYKTGIWRERKLANIIADCVFNDYDRVSYIACLYMIENTVEFQQNFESSEEEDEFKNAHDEKDKKKHRKISKKKEEK